ncbi:helix-turn-helix domain-containing protein [Pseudomonas sp. R-28-1W-6]|uniref:AraC family transcriptional regulator n=1 Tax=Pseudomonas sp. R-28-1W-6 TaxID=2650101 RepID=UPI0013665F92|nr:AraC family transcriptional regulator [Pseudomonas sp. R-28-1W-6]MWV10746.1 helix-turn-helix domain-containing protein [Pseudomonas sp. R-28-1W-6]
MLHSHLTTLHSVALILQILGDHPGVSAEDLLAGSGIRLADLQHPDIRISTAQEMRVCANAQAHCQELGLLMGRRMHVSSYGSLGYTLLASATLGDALRLALEYPALLGTYFELSLVDDGDSVWMQADGYRDQADLQTFNVEFCLASLKLICDDLLGQPLPLIGAQFRHAAPAYQAQYADSFACPLQFDAARNAFGFSRTWLERRLPLANPVTARDMREQCRQLNATFVSRQALVMRCRQLLAAQLQAPPGLEGLAAQLHCSPRSLRRHLHDAGSSYQNLLDELRYARARQLLEQQELPIHQIAEAMGYSETASFRHAFQRWSGVPPSRFRA